MANDLDSPPRNSPSTSAAWQALLGERALAFGFVCGLVGVSFGASVALTLIRWRNLEMSFFDFAYFDQIVWNTARGRWFESSFTPYNFLGQHFQPILLPFAFAYRLGAGPLVLTVAQSAVAIAAAFPLYGTATRLGLRPALAAVVAITYLASAYLHRTLDYDFHPEIMVAFPAFASAWLTMRGRFLLGAALALATLLFKEDAVFVALALAALLWWRGGKCEALATAATAILWTAFLILMLMPFLREGHSSNVMGRYAYLFAAPDGSGPGGTWLSSAAWRAATTLLDPRRLLPAALFVIGTGPLAIVRPWSLLVLLPGIAALLLSTHPPQRAFELHYGAVMLPVGILCGLLGTSWLAQRWPAGAVGALALAPVLAVSIALWPPSPAGTSAPIAQHRAAVDAAVAVIPADASVAAQSHLAPRLSRREVITEFPGGLPEAQWVIVDRYGHRSTQSVDAGFDAALETVRATYISVFAQDGVEVFRAKSP